MVKPRVAVILVALLVAVGVSRAAAQSAVQDSQTAVDLSYDFISKSETSHIGFHIGPWLNLWATEQAILRLMGEFGVTKFDFGSVLSIQGGARYVFTLTGQPKLRPFVQGLVGFERCCGSTDFSIQPGGGIFYAYSDRFDIIAQADFRHVRYEGFSDTHQRYSVGISIPVGGR
jgi:hypothetical protein